MKEGKLDVFEAWLRTVCFQKPTPEAHDLAKCAWNQAMQICEQTTVADCQSGKTLANPDKQ